MEMENPSMEWKPENNNGQNFVSIRGENKFSQWEKEEKKKWKNKWNSINSICGKGWNEEVAIVFQMETKSLLVWLGKLEVAAVFGVSYNNL